MEKCDWCEEEAVYQCEYCGKWFCYGHGKATADPELICNECETKQGRDIEAESEDWEEMESLC